MKAPGAKLITVVSFVFILKFSIARADQKPFIYLKAVNCQHNSKFLSNVTCFAKSYSRTISKATMLAYSESSFDISLGMFKMFVLFFLFSKNCRSIL